MSFLTVTQNPTNTNDNLTSKTPIGPLASLYFNKYSCSTHVYPRDLGASYRNHYVSFQFVKVNASELKDVLTSVVTPVVVVGAAAAAATSIGVATAVVTNSVTAGTALAVTTGLAAGGGLLYEGAQKIGQTEAFTNATSGNSTGISINPSMDKTGDTVFLYMPETLEFNYDSNYSELSIGEAVGESKLTSGLGGQAITSALEDPLSRLALNSAGYVYNPQQQLLFNGITFRTYQMSFTFTPYSKEEAATVTEIIKTFRKYAAPTVVTSAAGFFFNPPGMVDVTFKNGSSENNKMHKLKRSVLESVTVNYAPNGWASMEDGAPMQTTMTLSFKEAQLVDSKDINNGY